MDIVETLNLVAASLHGAQAVTVIALIAWLDSSSSSARTSGPFNDKGRFALTSSVPVWYAGPNNGTATTLHLDAGSFDVRYAVVAFFTLSCAFQTVAAVFRGGRSGPVLRYLEYSVSAATLLCAISVEAGVRDVYTVQAQFMLVFATMMLGIAAELTQRPERALYPCALFHLAGWATCLSAYVPAMDAFTQSARRSELAPPDFVRVLVFLEFALFMCFGFVQTYVLVAKAYVYASGKVPEEEELMPPSSYYFHDDDGGSAVHTIEERAEMAFIVLSLVAKTVLCWIVFAPILQAAM